MNQPTPSSPASSNSQPVRKEGADRLRTVLTASLCTLLGVNLLVMAFGKAGPSQASAQVTGYSGAGINAQPSTGVIPKPENIPSAPVSSPEILKRLVEQQIETNARLARIEASVTGPHQVTVTNWPAKDAAK